MVVGVLVVVVVVVVSVGVVIVGVVVITVVEPRSIDTGLIRTPAYSGQLRLSIRKAHIFPLN